VERGDSLLGDSQPENAGKKANQNGKNDGKKRV